MNTLEATFRIVTPMFMGGADKNTAEIRAPSIKGVLRFWYRAIDPNYASYEPRIFGGSGDSHGQAMFLLNLKHNLTGIKWDDTFECFNESHPDFQYGNQPDHASDNERTYWINGIRYLGYSLFMGENKDREGIPAGSEFTIELRYKQYPEEGDRRRILAALWLLGHFGSLGTRSRRGFGVLALQSISAGKDDEDWPEINDLPLAAGAGNIEQWKEAYRTALVILKNWFPGNRNADHSVFSTKTKICLLETLKADGCKNRKEWEYALDTAGKVMQKFRQRWDLADPDSDYFRIKQHLCDKFSSAAAVTPSVSRTPLKSSPHRVAFGLPLAFRYSSLTYKYQDKQGNTKKKTPDVTFEGNKKERSRSASRIWVRIAEVGEKAHPVFIRLDGPLLKPGDQVINNASSFPSPSDNILDTFWASIPHKTEIEWRNI